MSGKWIQGLRSSSLFRPTPQNAQQRQVEILAYVELFAQFTSEEFPDDIAELVYSHYPSSDACLLDDVLATFVLHHPEHGHAFIHPLLSCIIDGTLIYDKASPPFSSFISLFSPSSERGYSEQWALACGEILRVLTHYNRPVYKAERSHNQEKERRVSGTSASTSNCSKKSITSHSVGQDCEKRPLRLLTPWITDILLAAPLGIRSDYFRWCGGVMGKYAAAGELKPPTIAGGRGPGKHPQLMPSTPRWAVANGAGVILSVCDDEVLRYETANLTAAAVPALLLPPPTTALDEHLVAGLPPLEPYARLFHRYYAIASPSATQRLLLGLLEAPPSWAPDALDAAVQLVELLRAAEDYATSMRLPKNWIHLHFLRAIGTALTMRASIAADAAAALLFRILSQPELLFPPPRHAQCFDSQQKMHKTFTSQSSDERIEYATYQANIEATAQGMASLMCSHGSEVEWRICALWEAAYGLLPLSSSAVDLPELVVASPLQPPVLSWNLFHPLLCVLEYLPQGSPSEASLMKIFTATVEAVLKRTFLADISGQHTVVKRTSHGGIGHAMKNLAVAELRAMIHSLFIESCSSLNLASRLLFVVLTVCLSHDTLQRNDEKARVLTFPISNMATKECQEQITSDERKMNGYRTSKDRGAVATFDSYVLAAVCALACEVQLFSYSAEVSNCGQIPKATTATKAAKISHINKRFPNEMYTALSHIKRLLAILEALLSLKSSSLCFSPRNCSSNEIVASAVVAAHVSNLLGGSKTCMQSLALLTRCKFDLELCARASSILSLIETNGKAVAAISEKSRLSVSFVQYQLEKNNIFGKGGGCSERMHVGKGNNQTGGVSEVPYLDVLSIEKRRGTDIMDEIDVCTEKNIARRQMNALDVATLLTMDKHQWTSGNVGNVIEFILKEKQDLCVASVPLLWQRLVTAPDMQMTAESTSAEQGWRQVVKALCDVVSASPAEAATAVVLQLDG
eukprot:TRINITY_DN1599_c0_g1_i14.p1 TRINITY_DN1599_c0_g1~~TRINITY_DN1599_c0_g1_i14.p1  ORF type:complete len:973 (+),score=195.39 TRINITY_DN1599_c0_g1_i14:514-3432(+)